MNPLFFRRATTVVALALLSPTLSQAAVPAFGTYISPGIDRWIWLLLSLLG